MLLYVFLLTLLLLVLYSWFSLIWDARKLNFTGPLLLPLVGNGYLFFGDSSHFLRTLSQLAQQYNDAVRLYILHQRSVVISHPKYVEAVISNTKAITKGISVELAKAWLGEGVLLATGQKWKMHRKFLTPAFHNNTLQSYLPIFLKNDRILMNKLKKLADGKSIDLFPLMAMAALDNISESVMGVSINAQENSETEYLSAVKGICQILMARFRNPFLASKTTFNLMPMKRKQEELIKITQAYTNEVLESRRQQLKCANINNLDQNYELGMEDKHPFVDLMLLGEMDGKRMDNEEVREEVETFMFAGHDTTTSGLAFTLYCISQNKLVQEKILDEQRTILGDDIYRDPTYNELQQMKYLECVIKESFRLYSPVPLIERCVIQDLNAEDLIIPRGTNVIVNFFQMHRHPDVFQDPLEFRPERFEGTHVKPFDWMPFGAGPRICIGRKFAFLEIKVIVSSILKHFCLLPSFKEPDVTADVILKSINGVHVKFVPRA